MPCDAGRGAVSADGRVEAEDGRAALTIIIKVMIAGGCGCGLELGRGGDHLRDDARRLELVAGEHPDLDVGVAQHLERRAHVGLHEEEEGDE